MFFDSHYFFLFAFWLNNFSCFFFFFGSVVRYFQQVLSIQICLTVSCDLFSQRAEIVEWILQGGGKVVDDHVKQNVYFTIECHGVITRPVDALQTTCVSSHWIRSCLEVCLTDTYMHIFLSTFTTG